MPGTTAGELYMFGMLHQMVLVRPGLLSSTPRLQSWYQNLLSDARVKRVLEGQSPFGELVQYVPAPLVVIMSFDFLLTWLYIYL